MVMPAEFVSSVEVVGSDPWLDEADDGEEEVEVVDGTEFVVNPMAGRTQPPGSTSGGGSTTVATIDGTEGNGSTELDDEGFEMTPTGGKDRGKGVPPVRSSQGGGVGGLRVEEKGKVISINNDGSIKVSVLYWARGWD